MTVIIVCERSPRGPDWRSWLLVLLAVALSLRALEALRPTHTYFGGGW